MNAKEMYIGITIGIQFVHFTGSGNNLKVNTFPHYLYLTSSLIIHSFPVLLLLSFLSPFYGT